MYINLFILTSVAVSVKHSLLADQILAYIRTLHITFLFLIFWRHMMVFVVMSVLMVMIVITLLSQKSMRVTRAIM
jgi:hypothetical protein